ncbi:MAG: tol-pal system-associated acyl-CoA thioesterase [Betaproteobacteria bacterium]|jgi:acyl-CoA thioester hydrolase, YbgC/YbaW family|nr:tol-pal system-associated acyl-CoA thioesterase [Betaproteobacteria bacterium]
MTSLRHTVRVRIYHEDTDAAGVVYHANYLRYMERARTEWLERCGFDHERAARELQVLFVVRSLEVDFLRPARLGDTLQATVELEQVRRGLIVFRQQVVRDERPLVRAKVTVVCVSTADFSLVPAVPVVLLNAMGVEG